MVKTAAYAPAAPATSKRIHSIDLLRGTVMIIMALDHVRDYFHNDAFIFDPTDLSQTSPLLFFTRWITHFCAPVFCFLAGTSAYISGVKKSKADLSRFLFTRGLWLLVVEVLIITLAWSFNPRYPVIFLQVIWSLGISMIALAALVRLPVKAILIIGLVLIFGHNLLDPIHATGYTAKDVAIATLNEQHFFFMQPISVFMGYPVLAWIGIMLAGYAFGQLYLPTYDAAKRKKLLRQLGIAAIALFAVLRGIGIYGDPHPWSVQASPLYTFFSFINVTKYPPSLLYTLITLGPALLFLSYTEKPLNKLGEKLVVFGRVPMFYYILHIYLIHVLAVIAVVAAGHKWSDMVLTGWVGMNAQLKGYGYGLFAVYVLWILLIVMLYPLCRKYDAYKRAHREKWWLSYL